MSRGLALIVLAAAAGAARADEPIAAPPPAAEVVATARLFAMAIQSREPGALLVLMDDTVTYRLDDAGCGPAYNRPGKATRSLARKKLALCLSTVGWSRGGLAFVADGARATAHAFERELVLDLRAVGDELRVTAVTLRVLDAAAGEVSFDDWVRANHPRSAHYALTTKLIAGETEFALAEADRADLAASIENGTALDRTMTLKICVDAGGNLAVARVVEASKYPEWNARVLRGVRATWDFDPLVVNGAPSAVCGFAIFFPDR